MGAFMTGMINRYLTKKMISLVVGSVLVPLLAAKGIDLGIPSDQLSNVIWGVVSLIGSHQIGQGVADGLSKGVTSSSSNKL